MIHQNKSKVEKQNISLHPNPTSLVFVFLSIFWQCFLKEVRYADTSFKNPSDNVVIIWELLKNIHLLMTKSHDLKIYYFKKCCSAKQWGMHPHNDPYFTVHFFLFKKNGKLNHPIFNFKLKNYFVAKGRILRP